MKKLDPAVEELLRDLGRALSEAMATSEDVSRTVRRIRQEGYRLHVSLDCLRDEPASEPTAAALPVNEPHFCINMQDLGFLRSIGIDPTRRLRSRRRS